VSLTREHFLEFGAFDDGVWGGDDDLGESNHVREVEHEVRPVEKHPRSSVQDVKGSALEEGEAPEDNWHGLPVPNEETESGAAGEDVEGTVEVDAQTSDGGTEAPLGGQGGVVEAEEEEETEVRE